MTKTKQVITTQDAIKLCTNLYNQKQYDKCEQITSQLLNNDRKNIDAKFFMALICYEKKRYSSAEKLAEECLQAVPSNDQLFFLLARIKKATGQTKSAINYYEKSLQINDSNVATINNVANLYNEIGNNDKALEYFNRLEKKGVKRAFIYNNMCLIYKRVGMLNDAISTALKAIEIEPDCFEAHYNIALCYILKARNKKAIEHLETAYAINPDYLELCQDLHEILKKTCNWNKRKIIGKKIDQLRKEAKKKHLDVEHIDYKSDELVEEYLEVSRKQTQNLVKAITENYTRFNFENRKKDKNKATLNIGYISSDIKEHPVAHLMRGIFKNHSKENVQTFLYSFSPYDNSEYPKQIKEYVDNFIDINALSNYETAKRIYNDEIDILVDLNGHTGLTKLEALALKPAPIQVNYLGYIGSMGADFIDYILTDKIVTPPEDQKYYDEKFVYMPDCYQANDNDLEISEEEITKTSEGLPEDKLIFCSLNQTYKFEPVMFEVWMNILKKVPDSVLWLYKGSIIKDDNLAMENLKKEAKEKGVDPSRLIFAEPMSPISKHLKRTSLADIALDTRLYNGGTVTSQTLWAGVPVITLQGKVFQSRMASSILTAIGLKDMVTSSLKQYEELAIELASNKEKLKDVKSRLEKNKYSKPLYDTELFTSNLEMAYRQMWQNYCDGKPVNQIDLSKKQESLPF